VKIKEIKDFIEMNLGKPDITFVADASPMVFIDSAGIGFLVRMLKRAQSLGSNLVLRNLQGDIHNLFLQSGLNKVFTLETDDRTSRPRDDLFDDSVDLDLESKYELVDGVAVFHLSGVMVAPLGVKKLKEQALLAMADANRFLLDMENLTYMDSPAVGEILMLNGLLKTSGGEIRVCSLNDIMGKLFTTLGLERVIKIRKDAKEAMEGWGAGFPKRK
jgi:anti-anti-sigma factor